MAALIMVRYLYPVYSKRFAGSQKDETLLNCNGGDYKAQLGVRISTNLV